MKTKGFTLIELALVLAGIGILVGLAAPSYHSFLLRSRASEARALLEAIAHAELAWHRDYGSFIACAPSSDQPPRGVRGKFDAARPGWKELGLTIDGPVRYRYEVVLDGDSFKAVATGDLDGDGTPSRFALAGNSLQLTVENELE